MVPGTLSVHPPEDHEPDPVLRAGWPSHPRVLVDVVYDFSRLPHQVVELHSPAGGHPNLDWWLSPLTSSLRRIAAFCQPIIGRERALACAKKGRSRIALAVTF